MIASRIALVGNPNVGKSTLFNSLTGMRQHIGNFPGITVEKKMGRAQLGESLAELVDLPGVYSLIPQQQSSQDERVTLNYLLHQPVDVVINIVDATCLERHLYLTLQLAEMGLPMLVVVSKMDLAKRQGIDVDVAKLSQQLGVPVVSITATQAQQSRQTLGAALSQATISNYQTKYSSTVEQQLGDVDHGKRLETLIGLINQQHLGELSDDIELISAGDRYQVCNELAQVVVKDPEQQRIRISERIDKVVLNPWLALPVFFGAMYLMFMFTINIGNAFVDFFDISFNAIFVQGFGDVLLSIGTPEWLKVILADGLGAGVQTVSTFVPIIACLYLFLSFLEQSGYLARAACVVDRLMNRLGLPGSAFVPMIMGFGCTVPAVMATRTLERRSERVITSAMSHFMSCGARLPVFALFAAAFFPHSGQNIVFLLYILGIGMAVITGLVLRHTLLPGSSSSFVLELPPYELPSFGDVLLRTWLRLKAFVWGAGRVITLVVAVLGFFNSLGVDGTFGNEDTENSVLSQVSQKITPVFAPLGIHEDNWQATVGVFTGVFAKEVVVGTLNNLYKTPGADTETEQTIPQQLMTALVSIKDNFAGLGDLLLDPLGISVGDVDNTELAADEQGVSSSTFTNMQGRFDGVVGAFAYMLFILMYIPCASATGTMVRELGARWAVFIACWSTMLAYVCSSTFYQLATVSQSPLHNIVLSIILVLVPLITVWTLRRARVKHWFNQSLTGGQHYAGAH